MKPMRGSRLERLSEDVKRHLERDIPESNSGEGSELYNEVAELDAMLSAFLITVAIQGLPASPPSLRPDHHQLIRRLEALSAHSDAAVAAEARRQLEFIEEAIQLTAEAKAVSR